MVLCPTLRKIQIAQVRFEPTNLEHLKAFQMLCLDEQDSTSTCKQHKTLRFQLDGAFTDVRSMMLHRVGEYHCAAVLKRKTKKAIVT